MVAPHESAVFTADTARRCTKSCGQDGHRSRLDGGKAGLHHAHIHGARNGARHTIVAVHEVLRQLLLEVLGEDPDWAFVV